VVHLQQAGFEGGFMAFWSKERLELEQQQRTLVSPYDDARIEQCAYALGVAPEYAITSAEDGGVKRMTSAGEHITIPPGQFALLLSEERVSIPSNAIALISMKARFKLRGLINVSGFHVDPGFSGRLKFAVYNAGAMAVDLEPGQRLFLIWYSDLDQSTKAVYSGSHQAQDGITADDVMSIRGIVVSPAGVNSRVSALEETVKSELRRLESKIETHQNWARPILTGVAVALAFFLLSVYAKPLFGIGETSDTIQVEASPATPTPPVQAPTQQSTDGR
jgi:dCTP deaminase